MLVGAEISEDYGHDEALTVPPHLPDVVVRPESTEQVAAILRIANEHRVPVTVRGSGTGLSGACVATQGGVLLSTERLAGIKEIDLENHVAVVEPGVTLAQLDEAVAPHGLVYPILPGESSASIGGNVATNAGGMRAVKYGVTRNNVLGLEAVLPTGEVIRSGGKFVKSSTGLDLAQLIMGSEGLLAVVTEVTVRLMPRHTDRATLLLPFDSADAVTNAVPSIIRSGVGPLMLEYMDMLTMAACTQNAGIDLGIPQQIKDTALAYLVVLLEGSSPSRLQEDIEAVGELAIKLGAVDMFALPPQAGSDLLDAREKAFWVAKQAGAGDIVDVVVPRAAVPAYIAGVSALAQKHGTLVTGGGHAGDGNVHLAVFQPDDGIRGEVMKGLFALGMEVGGVISAEHGIGVEKRKYFLELEDPARLALMRRIKAAFDPNGILNPGTTFA